MIFCVWESSSLPGRNGDRETGTDTFLMKLKQQSDGELREVDQGARRSDCCLSLENVVCH